MDLLNETVLIVLALVAAHIGIYVWLRKKPIKNIRNRHVVVTGGSSGIGLWVAIHAVKQGAHVTIIARNVTNLELAVKQVEKHRTSEQQKIQYRSVDLSASYNAVAKALNELEESVGHIYMLVNCAGMAICGTVDEMSIEDARAMMDINYYATYYPTRYVLGQMKAAGEGIITITGSQLSLLGIYGMGAYTASKFALRGLAECLAMETAHTGVTVTLAMPADVDTPGYAQENLNKPEETKLISNAGGLAQPEVVGKAILEDSLRGSFISVSGFESWLTTIICAGMAPWGDFFFNAALACISGPIKLIGFGVQWHFRKIVRDCADKKQKTK